MKLATAAEAVLNGERRAGPQRGRLDQLIGLAKLLDGGLLTCEEFNRLKERLIDGEP